MLVCKIQLVYVDKGSLLYLEDIPRLHYLASISYMYWEVNFNSKINNALLFVVLLQIRAYVVLKLRWKRGKSSNLLGLSCSETKNIFVQQAFLLCVIYVTCHIKQ